MKMSLVTLARLCDETGVARTSRTFEVLRLRYVEGQNYRELGGVLGIRDLTARKLVSRWKRRVYQQQKTVAYEVTLPVQGDPRPSEIAEALSGLSAEERAERFAQGRISQINHALYVMEDRDEDERQGLSSFEQAVVILSAISGHQPAKPATPTYDDQGRKVGGGSQPMTVDELAKFITRADSEREGPRPWHQVPEHWKSGRVCDMGGKGVNPRF